MAMTRKNINDSQKIIFTGIDYHAPNRGVDALLIGSIACIIYKYPNAQISCFGGEVGKKIHSEVLDINNREVNIEFFGGRMFKQLLFLIISILYRISFRPLRKWLLKKHYSLKKFIESDYIVDLSYGDSFSELYGFRWFCMNALNKSIAFILQRPVIMFPQTLGPFYSRKARFVAKQIFRRVEIIYVRENISKNMIIHLIKDNSKIINVTDMAFLMEPTPVHNTEWKNNMPSERPKVGINISGLLFNHEKRKQLIGKELDYSKTLLEIINRLVKEKECFVYLIPHVYSYPPWQFDDLEACYKVYSQLHDQVKKNVSIVKEDYSAPELKWIIGQLDFFVGSRMHSCIGAISMRVPTMAVAYSHKFKGIMESIGLGNLVCDLKRMNEKEVSQNVLNAFDEKDEISISLKNVIPKIKKLSLECSDFARFV